MSAPEFKVGARVILDRRGCTEHLDNERDATIDRETQKHWYIGRKCGHCHGTHDH